MDATPVRLGAYELLCFGVAGVKYPTWSQHCLRTHETDPHTALKSSCVWGVSPHVITAECRSRDSAWICVCVCVCIPVWKCAPTSCVLPEGPALHPDRQNTECLVIKEQRNAIRGSHSASEYHIITDRQWEEGCRLQDTHCSPVGLNCSWLSTITRLLMVKLGVAGRDEQHERSWRRSWTLAWMLTV